MIRQVKSADTITSILNHDYDSYQTFSNCNLFTVSNASKERFWGRSIEKQLRKKMQKALFLNR